MNIHAPLGDSSYENRLWWVMVAGCATRFSADRSIADAVSGFVLGAAILLVCRFLRGRVAQPQQVANVIAIIGLIAFLLQLNSAGLLPALLVFLFAIEAAVFIIAAKRLHAWLILGAALGGVLFAAAESRSPVFLPCALWFTFASLSLLAADHRNDRQRMMLLQPAAESRERTGGVSFTLLTVLLTIPLYLFVPKPAGLMFGGMQATASHDYRPESEANGTQPTVEPAANVENSTNESEANDGSPSTTPSGESTTSTEPEPARPEEGDYGDSFSVEDIQRSTPGGNAIVLYAKSSRQINLRGLVYDRFESNRWHRDSLPFDDYALDNGHLSFSGSPQENEPVQQSIEIVRDLDATVIHAPGVRRLRFPGPTLRRYDDDVIVAPQRLRAPTTYSLASNLEFNAGRYSLRPSSRTELSRYLAIDGVSERIRSLAASITSGHVDATSMAFALESFLRGEYQYSYETIPQQGYTPLDTFLFETKRGHCEYFASALAVLLRTVGIPSRVVTGFSLSAPNPVTGFYEVRAFDGHAWVEAHLNGRWVMLEPTPFYPLPRSGANAQVADQLDGYLSRLAQTSEVFDPQSYKTAAARIARDLWQGTRRAMKSITDTAGTLGWLLPAALVLGAIASAIAYLAIMALADWLDNRALRELLKRAREVGSNQATLLTAQALEGASAPRGNERHAGASFREYLASLGEAGCHVPERFAEEFDVARYGSEARSESSSLDDVNRLIESTIEADRWPRARRTARAWRRWLDESIAR